MELFTNQVLAGIATGAIYACMALAVVMIYQAIDHLNFAQGEMAMFSTFISWQLMQWGVPYWGAFLLTLGLSFAGGIVIERLLFKPLAKAPILTNVADRELNAGMSLAEFKTIFWWEWSHRLLGRVIGVVYLLPFLWFLWRGVLNAELKRRLWLIFGLGALQGVVGWWMVASGLSQRVEVSQYRLATHLVLALLIFAAIVL